MKNAYLDGFRASLKDWVDERFLSKDDLYALAMFTMYLVNLLEDQGATYDGHSLRLGTYMCLLVVRGTVDGIPSVVFTNGHTPISCIRIFIRKAEAEVLEWTKDRFRQ